MRALFLAGGLIAALATAGCVSWQDEAGAEALALCEKKADPDERKLCRDSVRAAAEADHRAHMDQLGQQILEAEERERLRKVYGGAGQVEK